MSEETNCIWPEVDLTDSEDEVEAAEPVVRADPLKCDTLTEEEINGAFPPLLLPDGNRGSESSSEDDEDIKIDKVNPYLSVCGEEVKKKYTGKLRDLHLKRVRYVYYDFLLFQKIQHNHVLKCRRPAIHIFCRNMNILLCGQ